MALVPNSIPKLSKSGFEVFIEKDAGVTANHSNEEYEEEVERYAQGKMYYPVKR